MENLDVMDGVDEGGDDDVWDVIEVLMMVVDVMVGDVREEEMILVARRGDAADDFDVLGLVILV